MPRIARLAHLFAALVLLLAILGTTPAVAQRDAVTGPAVDSSTGVGQSDGWSWSGLAPLWSWLTSLFEADHGLIVP